MSSTKNFITILVLLGLFVFLGWYFWDILVYMIVALALAFIGKPIMNLLSRITIRKKPFPVSLSAVITLCVIIAMVGLVVLFLVPTIVKELASVTAIDLQAMGGEFESWVNQIDPFFRKYGFLNDQENVSTLMVSKLQADVSRFNMSNMLNNTFGVVKAVFIGTFSVLFMTFFSLKDHGIFFRMIREWIPVRYRNNFSNILNATGKQLSSYFIGVFLDMLIVGVIEFLLCWIFKIPNALLIGLVGGAMNIIPFVGPIIACVVGSVIALVSMLPAGPEAAVLMATLTKIIAIFCVTKLIDDFVLQPVIYGKRTQTHPLEIFIVILMAGSVGGVLAMIFAVPAYTILRIVVKEFFGAYIFSENTEGGEDDMPER